jgi:GTPase SAR1 family protein
VAEPEAGCASLRAGVGKSCLLLRFIDDVFEPVSSTIGVDFKLKHIVLNKKRLKLTVWDTGASARDTRAQ